MYLAPMKTGNESSQQQSSLRRRWRFRCDNDHSNDDNDNNNNNNNDGLFREETPLTNPYQDLINDPPPPTRPQASSLRSSSSGWSSGTGSSGLYDDDGSHSSSSNDSSGSLDFVTNDNLSADYHVYDVDNRRDPFPQQQQSSSQEPPHDSYQQPQQQNQQQQHDNDNDTDPQPPPPPAAPQPGSQRETSTSSSYGASFANLDFSYPEECLEDSSSGYSNFNSNSSSHSLFSNDDDDDNLDIFCDEEDVVVPSQPTSPKLPFPQQQQPASVSSLQLSPMKSPVRKIPKLQADPAQKGTPSCRRPKGGGAVSGRRLPLPVIDETLSYQPDDDDNSYPGEEGEGIFRHDDHDDHAAPHDDPPWWQRFWQQLRRSPSSSTLSLSSSERLAQAHELDDDGPSYYGGPHNHHNHHNNKHTKQQQDHWTTPASWEMDLKQQQQQQRRYRRKRRMILANVGCWCCVLCLAVAVLVAALLERQSANNAASSQQQQQQQEMTALPTTSIPTVVPTTTTTTTHTPSTKPVATPVSSPTNWPTTASPTEVVWDPQWRAAPFTMDLDDNNNNSTTVVTTTTDSAVAVMVPSNNKFQVWVYRIQGTEWVPAGTVSLSDRPTSLSLAPSHKLLVTTGNNAQVYHRTTGNTVWQRFGPPLPHTPFSPESTSLRQVQTATTTPLARWVGPNDSLAVGRAIYHYDDNDGTWRQDLNANFLVDYDRVLDVRFSPDGAVLLALAVPHEYRGDSATFAAHHSLAHLEVWTRKDRWTLRGPPLQIDSKLDNLDAVDVSPDGRLVVVVGNAHVQVYDYHPKDDDDWKITLVEGETMQRAAIADADWIVAISSAGGLYMLARDNDWEPARKDFQKMEETEILGLTVASRSRATLTTATAQSVTVHAYDWSHTVGGSSTSSSSSSSNSLVGIPSLDLATPPHPRWQELDPVPGTGPVALSHDGSSLVVVTSVVTVWNRDTADGQYYVAADVTAAAERIVNILWAEGPRLAIVTQANDDDVLLNVSVYEQTATNNNTWHRLGDPIRGCCGVDLSGDGDTLAVDQRLWHYHHNQWRTAGPPVLFGDENNSTASSVALSYNGDIAAFSNGSTTEIWQLDTLNVEWARIGSPIVDANAVGSVSLSHLGLTVATTDPVVVHEYNEFRGAWTAVGRSVGPRGVVWDRVRLAADGQSILLSSSGLVHVADYNNYDNNWIESTTVFVVPSAATAFSADGTTVAIPTADGVRLLTRHSNDGEMPSATPPTTDMPSAVPTDMPSTSDFPSTVPTEAPLASDIPSTVPTEALSASDIQSAVPTVSGIVSASDIPSTVPTEALSASDIPSTVPTATSWANSLAPTTNS